ncbi:MAG: B12-binding domain-containing radical SAM protein, partial [Bacillota bacterium]
MVPLFVAINAKFIHTNNAVRLLKANSSYASEFIEFTIKDDLDAIARTLIERNPLFIGISTYIWNVETVKSLVRTLKSNSDIPIILGGPEVSYDAKTFLESLPIDLVVKGEGEHIIDDVTAHYQDGASLEGVNNIAYRTSKGTVVDKPIVEIKDLSTLRSPHRFEQDIPDLENRIQYVESSRGCPFNCSYCLSSLEKKVRFFPLEQVLTDLEHLLENGAKTIKFLDRTFNANKDAQAIIDFLIEHRTAGSVFQFEITGEIMDEALIDHIHAHAPKHLFRFEIGIQSTHDQTNKLVRRFQDNAKLFHLIRKIREADIIDMHLDLIAGLPEESLDRFKKTFNDVFALGSRELQLGFLKFLRGTKIREEKDRFG